jgi:hypothetical protein
MMIKIGYGHESLLSMRPDIRHPDRPKIKTPKECVTKITSAPCDCASEHVEVWVKRVPRKRLVRLHRDQ